MTVSLVKRGAFDAAEERPRVRERLKKLLTLDITPPSFASVAPLIQGQGVCGEGL